MKPQEISTLFEYGYWAFEKVWDGVLQLSDAQFTQELGYSRGSIRNQVVHLMSATWRWVIRLKEEPMPPHLAFGDFGTRTATKAKWDELRLASMAYVDSLSEADLDGIVRWELPDRHMAAQNARWEILLHVANHATDHRSQILAMLNQHFGIETPEQDLLFYLLERK